MCPPETTNANRTLSDWAASGRYEARAAIAAIIAETGAASMKDMGKVMAEVKSRHATSIEPAKASALVGAATVVVGDVEALDSVVEVENPLAREDPFSASHARIRWMPFSEIGAYCAKNMALVLTTRLDLNAVLARLLEGRIEPSYTRP